MGECSFRYRPTRVVPDQRPLNGRCCCCCCNTHTHTQRERERERERDRRGALRTWCSRIRRSRSVRRSRREDSGCQHTSSSARHRSHTTAHSQPTAPPLPTVDPSTHTHTSAVAGENLCNNSKTFFLILKKNIKNLHRFSEAT